MHSFCRFFVVVFFLFLKSCLAFLEAEISSVKVDAKLISKVVETTTKYLMEQQVLCLTGRHALKAGAPLYKNESES